MQDTSPQFLSTAEAASMLGLSTTLIQSLVDRNELSGWKTRGGHRRIALQSVLDYKNHMQAGRHQPGKSRNQPKIMVVVETPDLLQALQAESQQWPFTFGFRFINSISAALLDLAEERPDVLIVELAIPRSLQVKTMDALREFNARGRPMSIALITQETDLMTESPTGIQVVGGPLNPTWLHAFLTGVQATWNK